MEQKIDLEIRLRELASQSLAEARTEIDVLEIEKSLLTSDQRLNCYASQLEQRRKQLSSPVSSQVSSTLATTDDSGRGSKASRRLAADTTTLTTDNVSEGLSSPLSVLSSPQSSPSSKMSPVSGESTNQQPNDSNASSSSPASSYKRRRNSRPMRAPASSRTNNATGGSHQTDNNTTTTLDRRRTSRQNLSANSHKSSSSSMQRANSKQRETLRVRQTITSASNINCNMVVNNSATITLSELRIPLMWRDVDHFKGRGEYKRYAVFCLLKLNSQIYDTQLIADVDRQLTDLTFDDVLVFGGHNNQINHDNHHEPQIGPQFELELEVYSCVYLEQYSLTSTPRKLKEKLSNSVSRAMGRRLLTQTASTNYTRELDSYYDKSYRFALIASAKLHLNDASDSCRTYDLELVSPEAHGRHHQSSISQLHKSLGLATSSIASTLNTSTTSTNNNSTASNQKELDKNTLPLFGHFCCKLHVRPDVFDKNVKSGYLRVACIELPDTLVSEEQQDNNNVSSANESAMLRSALAASSKLANLSMSSSKTSAIYWALLRNFTLHLWQIDTNELRLANKRGLAPQVDISRMQPFCVNIDKRTRLLRVSNSSLTIETQKGCFVLAVYSPNTAASDHVILEDEIGHWLRPIEQMIYDSHVWAPALNHLSSPNSHRNQ